MSQTDPTANSGSTQPADSVNDPAVTDNPTTDPDLGSETSGQPEIAASNEAAEEATPPGTVTNINIGSDAGDSAAGGDTTGGE